MWHVSQGQRISMITMLAKIVRAGAVELRASSDERSDD
jgi:hypothetical protein